ncbi:MAG: hypothetical protein RQ756_03375 [Flavobacteriaceae bacterium]|nr:hypothetical protein [Flavobacteriaceae bacterium]
MEDLLTQVFFGTVPALIIAGISFVFFNSFVKNEDQRRRYLLHRDNQKQSLPIRLQAYERMALYLERIKLSNLVVRTKPNEASKTSYERQLVKCIEEEFEHNITQQVYLSDELWNIVRTAKNSTIQLIRQIAMSKQIDSADKLREYILSESMEKTSPSETAMSFLKNEISDLW